jgi:hypothetical protein
MTMKFWRVDTKTYHRAKKRFKTPAKIVEATVSGTLLTLTFDQPVKLLRKQPPPYMTDVVGAEPVSAVLADSHTLKITYSESIDAAEEVTIPYQNPSVQTMVGGFVADSTFRLAA